MTRFWFKLLLGTLVFTVLSGTFLAPILKASASKSNLIQSGSLATVIYSEAINIRGGPNTVDYPVVGRLAPGEVVPALGVSPGHEWVQISFPSAPGGVGWVYAIYVEISGDELLVVEIPSTPTPLVTATIDPTLAAAFNFQPTASRVPTFTPPPPLVVPQFPTAEAPPRSGLAPGFIVLGLIMIGLAGLVVSFVIRR